MTIRCIDCGAHAEGSGEFMESLEDVHRIAAPDHVTVITREEVH
jgi:hypothetical protein